MEMCELECEFTIEKWCACVPTEVPKLVKENNPIEPGEMGPQLRAPATPPEVLISILSTHMLAHNWL